MNQNMMSAATKAVQFPPLVRFPSFKLNVPETSTSNTNPVADEFIDLRNHLEVNRLATQRTNIVQGLANQSMVIPGSSIAELFDIKLSFIPKSRNM